MSDPSGELLQSVIERLLRAGWIGEGAATADGDNLMVRWTPEGHAKASQFFALLEEFGIDAEASEFTLFRALMRQGLNDPPQHFGKQCP